MSKNFKKILVFILLISALITSFIFNVIKNKEDSFQAFNNIINYDSDICQVEKPKEMRGIWVSFIDLSLPEADKSEDAFKKHFDQIVSDSKAFGANTLIVQVRPFCDSLYKSKYFPSSHILTGKQGAELSYDPLEYMIKKCHESDLLIHAWINPLRVKTLSMPSELAYNNPGVIWKDTDYVLTWEGAAYLNPAYSEVRKLIINGVKEIVENYDIDGIHFDDYFYPTMENDFDKKSYNIYLESLEDGELPLTLNKWRTANISSLISGVYSAIKNIKKNVAFGISPQGNIENDLNMGADVYSWCSQKGYVDYICPQIYFNFEHKILPFDETVDKWTEIIKTDGIDLYIGLGLYKAGSEDDGGTWLDSDDIIKKEIEYCRKKETDGFCFYSYSYIKSKQTLKEVENISKILT